MLRLRCRVKIKHEEEILVSIVKDSAFSFNNQFRIYKQFRIKTQFFVQKNSENAPKTVQEQAVNRSETHTLNH